MVRKLGWAFVVAILLALVDWQPKVVVETVEVEKVVIETVVVEVEKVVIETVIVEKEVEVEKTIIETVIEAKEVIIKTVIVEVEVEVEVTPTPLVPVTMFSTPGTFRVGVEIEPGVYKVVGEGDIPDCYWARLKCFDGTTVCLVVDKVVRGFGYVEVKATDLALETYAVNSGASCTFTLQN